MASATGTFDARIRQLADSVGDGHLVGSLERNQVYAKVQHEDLSLRHLVGQAKYQEAPLLARHRDYLQAVADAVLDGDMVAAMARQLERFDTDSAKLTPKDLTILARSGRPQVRSGQEIVYDRPPDVPRLSPAELYALQTKIRGIAYGAPPGLA